MKVYDVPTLVDKFMDKQYLLNMGKGKLSNYFDVTKGEIARAKTIARNKLQFGTEYHPSEVAFKRKPIINFPKILIFDVETTPSVVYTFGRFKQNIAYNHVERESLLLTWSAKWLYSTEIISDKLTSEEVLREDDSRIVMSLWDLINEADIVVAHYGDGFDIPFLSVRAVINQLPPFISVRSIDTKKVTQFNFKFPSNKLDALGTYFGVGNKIDTDMELWIQCTKGNQEAIDEISRYNDQDVILLEEVYLKLRPWIKSHPNIGMYLEKEESVCSCCGSDNIKLQANRFYYTQTTKYPIYRCNDCGGLTRGRKTVLSKEVGKALGTSIPR